MIRRSMNHLVSLWVMFLCVGSLTALGCSECKTDADCASGQLCEGGKCKAPDAPLETDSPDSDPPVGQETDSTGPDSDPPDSESARDVCEDPERDCPAPAACAAYVCDDGACVAVPQSGVPCEADDNECTADVCVAGECVASPLSGAPCASDGNDCTEDVCVSGVCEHRPTSGGSCADDGNPCTTDICDRGVCGAPLPDGVACEGVVDSCKSAVCQAGACVIAALPDGTPCDDGAWCNGAVDRCLDGACVPTPGSEPCVGGGPCALVTCAEPDSGEGEGVCGREILDGVPCDDGLFCNGADMCVAGTCVHSGPPCDLSTGVCDVDVCDEEQDACGVEPVPDGEPCLIQDGLLCNGVEKCEAGECVAGAPFCPVFNDCTQNSCIEGEGDASPSCEGIEPARDGEPCGTTVACDGQGDRFCMDGLCAHGETPACGGVAQDGNLCTRFALCFEEDGLPVCRVEQDDRARFLGIGCGETSPFDTLASDNEVQRYEGEHCPGSFGGGEQAFIIDAPGSAYTVALSVDQTTRPGEPMMALIVTDPCAAEATCIAAGAAEVSGVNSADPDTPHVIVVDGLNGARGRGTITLSCP